MFGPSTPAPTTGMADSTNNVSTTSHHHNNNAHNQDNNANMFEDTWSDPNMWYLPPGAAFFQNIDSTSVAMTAEGVHVGGLDLLDYMAMDPSDPNPGYGVMDGPGF